MLESITIRQIALIDEATICFHNGMQVLTGETGAGKSIVVDAVNLILGGRADRDLIRSGKEKASVEAVFDVPGNAGVALFMEQEGIEYDGRTVTIYREISVSGKNVCRVCGVMIPVSRLKDLSVLLMDIHGQNEHQFLTDPDRQLAFLDQFGDDIHKRILLRTSDDCSRFLENHRAYAKLVKRNENRESHMMSLERDIGELRKAKVIPGESARLLTLRKELADNEKRSEKLQIISNLLSGGEDGMSALSRIKSASDAIKAYISCDTSVEELGKRCEAVYYDLEDIAYQISLMKEKAGYDPESLEQADSRLDLIHRLERKYGISADEIPETLNAMEEEYRQLTDLESEISRMSAEHKKLLSIYRNTARDLTQSRKKIASHFETRMMEELADLGMENTRFSVAFGENDTGRPVMPSDKGDDRIEFLISPNPGEPLKPLSKIASGGELSRIMLAVKTLESSHTGVESMVFDEIDTGISGRMAQVVAEKMITVSQSRQVICVTHLPQIAAAADYHYLVKKATEGDRTTTSVTELDRRGRISEVSRMISGADGITSRSDTYASQMIESADLLKQKHPVSER